MLDFGPDLRLDAVFRVSAAAAASRTSRAAAADFPGALSGLSGWFCGLASIRAGLFIQERPQREMPGVPLRNSSTSVSVAGPPDKRFGSCLTKERPEAVSRISCQRSPFELL